MSGWNQAPLPRDQILLFRETLGDRIPENHSVRLFAEILDSVDWSSWEQHYVLAAGQPPIHPRIMAGAVLYGLSHGIRSSRRLEWACGNAVDFMWLVEGRTIDHSTFCDFRTRFKRELKDLFRQIGRLAMHLGLIRLNQVALDGTRVKANSSRHATASGKTLEQRLKALDEQIEKMLAEACDADQQDKDLFGDRVSASTLPAELSDLNKRQERLRKAFAAAQQADAKRAKCQSGSKRSAKVPVAQEDWAKLPRRPQSENKLDRAAFVYDAAKDCYYCPQGRTLVFDQIKAKGRATCGDSQYRVYKCESCAGCGLSADCLVGQSKRRTVSHDQHEPLRQEVALRLKTESGRKTYARRAHLAETPNGVIKDVMGLRQFLSRGLDKVRTEWLWACTAFNIRKLVWAMEGVRAAVSLEPV